MLLSFSVYSHAAVKNYKLKTFNTEDIKNKSSNVTGVVEVFELTNYINLKPCYCSSLWLSVRQLSGNVTEGLKLHQQKL